MRDKTHDTLGSDTIHVKVTVQKNGDSYEATYDPKIIDVYSEGAVINFKLVTPTPDDVVVSAVDIQQKDQDQLSTPSISKNGKQVTLNDINTLRATFNLDFTYKNKHGNIDCSPKGRVETVDYPMIENNPPGMEGVMVAALDGVPDNNPPG